MRDDPEIPPPNEWAKQTGATVAAEFRRLGIEPSRIGNSGDGGVFVAFVKGHLYADIECFNSEEVIAAMSNRRDHPIVWDVPLADIPAACERIRQFMQS